MSLPSLLRSNMIDEMQCTNGEAIVQIIDQIEIKYFRSVYSVSLKNAEILMS